MFKLRYLLPLALVTGLLVVPASASANSAAATISIAGNATLISGSPGPVAVTLHYSCLPPSPAIVGITIDENGVIGGDSQTATCDGQNHSATVTVPGAFTPGTAQALAMISSGIVREFIADTIAIK